MAQAIYRKYLISRHKQQKKAHAYHESIKTTVKIPLHRREVHKHNPKQVIGSDGELVTVAHDYATGHQSPQAQKHGNARKFYVDIRDGIKN